MKLLYIILCGLCTIAAVADVVLLISGPPLPTAVRLLFEAVLAYVFYRAWRRARVSDSS